jgi:hypothetical protein
VHVAYRTSERIAAQWCKRFTRLSYAFSKNWASHKAASLHFAYYNFVHVHRSIKQTLAMAAGLAARALTLAELLS